jgi:NAD(P)-dependent dehydrogenase (short-subunit alcohol dehydrogenase family)
MGPGDPDESQRVLLLHLGGHPDHDRAKLRSDRRRQLDERPGPRDGAANYSASKGGIIAFTRTAAAELVNSGITVNAVCPGYTETDMFDAVPQALQTIIKGKIPMGRFAHPEEIVKAVLFLVADGDYITGQQINVNGGAFM